MVNICYTAGHTLTDNSFTSPERGSHRRISDLTNTTHSDAPSNALRSIPASEFVAMQAVDDTEPSKVRAWGGDLPEASIPDIPANDNPGTLRKNPAPLIDIEQRRDNLSKALADKAGAARYVIDVENRRVEELLDEQYVAPHAGRLSVRTLLTKVGLHEPRPPQLIERPYLEESQQRQKEMVTEELAVSRGQIRDGIVEGVDDVAVDDHLGLRTDNSILPPLFRELHRQEEEKQGHGITFLTWMADHATDEQLTNVWQWHDKYLSDLDNDPAFREKVSSVKEGFSQGFHKAIEAGALHPDIALQRHRIDAAKVVHGSPLSPALAVNAAWTDRTNCEIQIRDGVNSPTLYHELTHLLVRVRGFDEAVTDLVAATIYNHYNPEQGHVDPRGSVYADQIAALAAVGRMTEDAANVYELSRICSGPDSFENIISFATQADEAIGMPITIPLLVVSNELIRDNVGIYNEGILRLTAQFMMRERAEFLAAMMLDDEGNRVAKTPQDLIVRMLSPDTLAKYGQNVIFDGLNIVRETLELQGKMAQGSTTEET